MTKWKNVQLADVVSVLGDGIHGTPTYSPNGECFFINGNNLSEGRIIFKRDTKRVVYSEYLKHKKALTDRTILVSINGTIGNLAFYRGEKCILGKSACYLNIKLNISKKFIFFILQQQNFQNYAKSQANGTTIKNVSLKQMREYEFLLPPLEAQERIAEILSTLDDKIELNAQINQNLEAQARAIFKSWFIDFEPFRDGEFVDSELGPIPKGWSPGVLADIVDFCKQRIRVSELSPTTYISTENMLPNGGGIVDASSLPSVEYVTAFQKNDVLVSNIRPYFKKIWYCAFSGGCSNDVLCFSAKKTIPSEYIYSILNDEIFFAYVTAGAKGTKMPRGDKSQIMAYPVIRPADSALKKFSELMRPMIAQIRINENESQCLSQLRDTLLPKLMSGEIDVSAVEV